MSFKGNKFNQDSLNLHQQLSDKLEVKSKKTFKLKRFFKLF